MGIASPNLHISALDLTFFRCHSRGMDIIAHIKSRGMTVAGVARVAGVSRPSIYALNDPAHKPALETVLSVAKAIGVTPADIRPEIAA